VTHARQAQRRVHRTEVDHLQLPIQLPRQYADGRTTGDKVMQHLPGHFLGIRRHTFGNHAVIPGKNRNPHVINRRFDLALQASQLHGQRFQLTEGTGRLGQLLLARQGLFVRRGVNRLTRVEPPGVSHIAIPFKVRGRPATVRTTR